MKVLDSRLKNGVALLADMFLHSRFAQEDLELERGVVLEEIDMYEDSPEDVAIDKLFERCYDGSALGRPILGTAETLELMTSETLHKYMREYYRPQDTVVAVSGHFTDDDLDFIEELFSEMEGEGKNVITPAAYQPSLFLRDKEIEQNHLCLSFPGVSLVSEDRFTMNLLSSILGGGMSSRLFQSVREQNGLCYSIYTFTTPHLDTGLLSIYTGLGQETERKALDLILRELDEFCQNGPAPDELSRCREQVKTTLLMGLENTGNRMMTIGRSELLRGEVSKIEEVLDSYDSVTADDILNLARRVFDRSKASLAVVGPAGQRGYIPRTAALITELLAQIGDHIPTGDNAAEDTASVHYRYKILRCDQIDHILHACINAYRAVVYPQFNLTDGQLFEGFLRVMQH